MNNQVPSTTAIRRASRFLDGIDNGCNEVKTLRALLAKPDHTEQPRGMVVPSGWQWMPIVPTIEIIAAIGFDGDVELAIGHAAISDQCVETYNAMLAAAPAPGDSQ